MVKDKLRKALQDAVACYNEGMSANDAIVKSATDNDLTVDQTDRVVESFNTAKTINFFDKNASDRTGKFDLASKRDVTLALFGRTSSEKTASAPGAASASDPDGALSSFYAGEPDRSANRKSVFAEKRAALLDALAKTAEERWSHGYSDRTLQDMASDAYSVIKSAEEDAARAIGTIDDYLWTATEKIASGLAGAPYGQQEDRADMFKAACPHKLVVDEVSRFCPLLKKATGGVYAKMNVVDTAPVDDLLKEADDIMEAVAQRRQYRMKQAQFRGRAERLKAAMLSDPSLSGLVPEKKASDMVHRPAYEKKADIPYGSLNSALNDALTGGGDSNKKVNEQIRDDARGAILADLLSADPILQDADPRQVASIYKSLVSTSPRVSLNKEIVRSILRSAVNSVALSPSDSKIFTDVDKGIQTAYGGLAGGRGED